MAVSRKERQLAKSLAHEQDLLVRRALNLATRKMSLGLRESLKMFRVGRDPISPILERIDSIEDILLEIMIASHLSGFLKTQQFVPIKLAFKSSINFLRKRAELSEIQIERLSIKYTQEALRILPKLKGGIDRALRKSVLSITEKGLIRRDAVIALRKAFNAVGLTSKSNFLLETVFRTQIQIAYGAGRFDQEQAPEIQEILWGYKYVTVGDDRVREEHVGFDGVTLPKEDPFWTANYPPNGWNCRCQVISIFEERKISQPKAVKGITPQASKGFDFNPGLLFRTIK